MPLPKDSLTKIFVTKYALSRGIYLSEAKIYSDRKGAYIGTLLYLNEKEYALTAEEAVKQAEERRIRELQALDRRAKRLAKLDFQVMAEKAQRCLLNSLSRHVIPSTKT